MCAIPTNENRTVRGCEEVLDGDYSDVEKVVLVMVNLSTHGLSRLNEAFALPEAWRLTDRMAEGTQHFGSHYRLAVPDRGSSGQAGAVLHEDW